MSEHTFKAQDYQYDVLTSHKKIIAFIAGVGTGKTTVASVWMLMKIKEMKPDELGLLCANTYMTLVDATLTNFYKYLHEFNIPVIPFEKPTAHRPVNIKVNMNGYWVTIFCRSLSNYETLSGIEVAWAVIDETFLAKLEAFNLILARLRGGKGKEQALIVTTPDTPAHWLYKLTVEDFDEAVMDVVNARTEDNKKNLPAGYIELMKSMYDPSLFERMCNAKWLALNENKVYYSFDRDLHVAKEPIEINPHFPLLWMHDFNCGVNKPMSSAIGQLISCDSKQTGVRRYELRIIDEIIIDKSSTYEVIEEFRARYGDKYDEQIVIYGDPAGKASDTRSKLSDYDIMYQAGFMEQLIDRSAPAVRTRHNLVNSVFMDTHGDIRIQISPNCKTVIKGFDSVTVKEGATYTEVETREQHVTTAIGYCICKEFEINTMPYDYTPEKQYYK